MLETIMSKLGYTKTSHYKHTRTDNNYLLNKNGSLLNDIININKELLKTNVEKAKLRREIRDLKKNPYIVVENVGKVDVFNSVRYVTQTELDETFMSEAEFIHVNKTALIFEFLENNFIDFFKIKRRNGKIELKFEINILNKRINCEKQEIK